MFTKKKSLAKIARLRSKKEKSPAAVVSLVRQSADISNNAGGSGTELANGMGGAEKSKNDNEDDVDEEGELEDLHSM